MKNFVKRFGEKIFFSKRKKSEWEYRENHTSHRSSGDSLQIKKLIFLFLSQCTYKSQYAYKSQQTYICIMKVSTPELLKYSLPMLGKTEERLRRTRWLYQKFSEVLSALRGYVFQCNFFWRIIQEIIIHFWQMNGEKNNWAFLLKNHSQTTVVIRLFYLKEKAPTENITYYI